MAYTNINDPSAYFTTTLYTGNGSTQDITNNANAGNFKPDYIWTKARGATGGHTNQNSNVGAGKQVYPHLAYQEETVSGVSAFLTNGFSLGSNGTSNANGITHVAWQWKCNGGTTTSKSSATVSGNVTTPCVQQVNTDAGFSILTYTASTSYAGTETHLEHGLGVGPRFLLVKRRDASADWAVYHADNGASPSAGYGYLVLNSSAATATSSTYWLNTNAESNATLLAFGNNTSVGADGGEYVCYAFAEKQGYSKFSKYVGNGVGDGPFVYTGFKPAFVMFKRLGSQSWDIHDSTRDPFNPMPRRLLPNLTEAEETRPTSGASIDCMDFLSNGFKIKSVESIINTSGDTYVYMAFAENPFVTSTGIPTTAR